MQLTFVNYLPTPATSGFSQSGDLSNTFPAEPVLRATDSSAGAGSGGKREPQEEDTGATAKTPSSSPQPMGKSGDETESKAGEEDNQEKENQLPGMKEKDGYFKSDMSPDTGTGNV